jgi:hypothetical protein
MRDTKLSNGRARRKGYTALTASLLIIALMLYAGIFAYERSRRCWRSMDWVKG